MVACLLPAAAFSASPAQGPQAHEAQVRRGAATFEHICSRCHAKDMTGGQGPALKGDLFVGRWVGKPARALYSRILLTMPLDGPGTLTPKQVLDIAAFIVSVNELQPAGVAFKSAEQLGKMTLQARQ